MINLHLQARQPRGDPTAHMDRCPGYQARADGMDASQPAGPCRYMLLETWSMAAAKSAPV